MEFYSAWLPIAPMCGLFVGTQHEAAPSTVPLASVPRSVAARRWEASWSVTAELLLFRGQGGRLEITERQRAVVCLCRLAEVPVRAGRQCSLTG